MISGKATERPMMLTSHRVQMKKIADRIGRIPEERRSESDKRILEEFALEEHGILTSGDVQEMKREVKAKGPAQGSEDGGQGEKGKAQGGEGNKGEQGDATGESKAVRRRERRRNKEAKSGKEKKA